jgi:hypothetical protein
LWVYDSWFVALKKPIFALMAALGVMVSGTVQGAVTFDWATVGDVGNAADPLNS